MEKVSAVSWRSWALDGASDFQNLPPSIPAKGTALIPARPMVTQPILSLHPFKGGHCWEEAPGVPALGLACLTWHLSVGLEQLLIGGGHRLFPARQVRYVGLLGHSWDPVSWVPVFQRCDVVVSEKGQE